MGETSQFWHFDFQLIQHFQILFLTFLTADVAGMAGDGGNDCGGLRAAHAGLALSDAEAESVAGF